MTTRVATAACAFLITGFFGVLCQAGPFRIRAEKGNGHVFIPYSEMDRRFLLSAAVSPQFPMPFSESRLTRQVYFHHDRTQDRVFLMGDTSSYSLVQGTPSRMILAVLPVVEKRARRGVLVNLGSLDAIFSAGNIVERSDALAHVSEEDLSDGLEIDASFFSTIESDTNRLFAVQVARLNSNPHFPTTEIRYILEPLPGPEAFEPVMSGRDVSSPFLEGISFAEPGKGRFQNPVFRWNVTPEQPIRMALSSRIPQEFRQTVREGILYWNRAFGWEAITVIDAPPGVTAPHPDYNVIEWIDFETAPYAYADFRANPTTGQILGAQIFLPSVWAIRGRTRWNEVVAALDTEHLEHTHHDGAKTICKRNQVSQVAAVISNALGSDLTDNDLNETVHDLLRAVVAHEMGHVLGLAHNFVTTSLSGSATDPFLWLDPWNPVASPIYSARAQAAGSLRPLSTVMHYPNLHEDILSGRQALVLEEALPFDRDAIRNLYVRRSPRVCEHFHCADEGVGVFLDVHHRTSGSNPLLANLFEMHSALAHLPNTVVEAALLARGTRPLSEVEIKIEKRVLKPFIAAAERQLRWFSSTKRSRVLEQLTEIHTPYNAPEYRERLFFWMASLVEESGRTVDELVFPFFRSLFGIDADLQMRWAASVEKLIVGSELTHDEADWARVQLDRLGRHLGDVLVRHWVRDLLNITDIALESSVLGVRADNGPTRKLEQAIGGLVEGILLATTSEGRSRFSIDTRLEALDLLDPKRFPTELNWGASSRVAIAASLERALEVAYGDRELWALYRKLDGIEVESKDCEVAFSK